MMTLTQQLNTGIGAIAAAAGRFYLGNRAGRRFITALARQTKRAQALRAENEATGLHVPPFLIASIATQCNLHCAGCYARAGGACGDEATKELDAAAWRRILAEAAGLGVSFALLAGGEPLLRPDVLHAAAECREIVFPVFTNGTLLDEKWLAFFDTHRHIIPVLSVEGDAAATDARRGAGVSARVAGAMAALQKRGILFGASVTVTTQNLAAVVQRGYVKQLEAAGCGVLFYVEYVPVEAGTDALVLGDADLAALNAAVAQRKREFRRMAVLSFPGDEEAMGGCLAAGRGFFHISPTGGAEPCPFSPHAAHSLQTSTLREVLASEYFAKVREISAAHALSHAGGCTLHQHDAEVRALLEPTTKKAAAV